MKLVVDANVLIAALIRSGISRDIIMSDKFALVSRDYLNLELNQHKNLISQKSGLSENEIAIVMTILLRRIDTIPLSDYQEKLEEAVTLMKENINDAPYVACFLALRCDGIWTNDSDFKGIHKIKVFQTKDLV
ncbi:MAG: PIN domain-containing protein [Candidatus Thermoplasmatota archaeon]|jgi:predicted nucleic acid-binding protein|nr:PIN domain-containing protein [Candidatus Thermoplasmatota archaeon]MCL5789648.1 PIN domain-containing protein [Candidatus Thermoplasmatota archaeon]